MMSFWMNVPSYLTIGPAADQFQLEHYHYVIGFEKMDYSFLERNFGFPYSDKINMELLNRGYIIC